MASAKTKPKPGLVTSGRYISEAQFLRELKEKEGAQLEAERQRKGERERTKKEQEAEKERKREKKGAQRGWRKKYNTRETYTCGKCDEQNVNEECYCGDCGRIYENGELWIGCGSDCGEWYHAL